MSLDDLWTSLRQGSRNVAGVSWQVNVCAYLLVAARAGQLPFVDLIPEGFEDADCVSGDGTRTLVQMKELGGGHGEIDPSGLAAVLSHAEASARGAEIVVLTDGLLGSDLSFTGWGSVLGDQSGAGIARVLDGIVSRGYAADEAVGILARSRVVRLPYRVRQTSEAVLAEAFNVHPTVAGIAVSRLTDVLARISGDQRHATGKTAARVRTSDLDAIVAEVQESVDVAGLDQAVASGVCSPVSFLAPDAVPARVFYMGVDGHPGHVAANLDVIRPDELLACAEGLSDEGSVLLVGPSGAGKSVLLWRVARDLVPAARVLRVVRVQDEDDARELARHVRLLRPNDRSPVMVVADDLGRPNTTGWPHAASLLREIPAVLLLGAARAEDFTPALFVGATRVVEPRLDGVLADALGKRLHAQGITLRMDPDEAFQRSDRLLMEFLALLTTGQRLRQVIATQVTTLQAPDRAMQREVARLVTAAHTLGLGVNADGLGSALTGDRDLAGQARVGDALGVLRDEHIVVSDGDTWRGLHELRSATISELLHNNPPPRLGNTLARVAGLIHPGHSGWMLRRVAERHPACVMEVVEALGRSFNTRSAIAGDLAAFLEGAERADNALYARATLPILERTRPSGQPLEMLAMLVYWRRNQDGGFDEIGVEQFDSMARRITTIADQLPVRSGYDSALPTACAGLDINWVEAVLNGADVLDALRVLEAGNSHLPVPIGTFRSLLARATAPCDIWSATIWSRLAAACHAQLSPADAIEILGSVEDRVRLVCSADRSILDAVVDEGTSSVTVTRLLPLDGDVVSKVVMPWDIPRAGAIDALNESIVACLERVKDACPELQRFEISTVNASGAPYRLQDFEPGHKNMLRSTFRERASVRQAVGYQAAFRRATSSETWTEVITTQISAAADLATAARELPLRLKPHDNPGRRAAWRAKLGQVRDQLGALRAPPVPAGQGPSSAQALDDNSDRTQDETTRVLRAALDALDNACPEDCTKPQHRPATAIALREAADKIDQARRATRTFLQGRGPVLPDELSDAMRHSADLAAALHREPGLARLVRAADPLDSAVDIWEKVKDKERIQSGELLGNLLRLVPQADFGLVEDPNPASWALDSRSWVVFAPAQVLDETLALLAKLDDTAREQLGPHLVVLCVADLVGPLAADAEIPPPTNPHGRVSLGFGYQLGSSAERNALLVPPDAVSGWSRAAGLQLMDYANSAAAVAEQFINRSQEAARRRMRRLPEPDNACSEQHSHRIPSDPAAPYASFQGNPESAEFEAAISLLGKHVAAEEEGTVSVYLCEVVLRPVTGVPLDPQAEVLLEAMAALHIDRMREAVAGMPQTASAPAAGNS